jgi:EAL domain-containing protein (putative c-di-GMP-specific phosphodiesterase class I)
MEGMDGKIATLLDLKALGAHMSLDDFGTGYSSLNHLKRLPVDNVKIDRSFVRMITMDSRDAAIASTIIAMAHQMGMRVIAEGVELPEQLEFLQKQDCDVMQGYLFSPPITAEDFTRLLQEGRCLFENAESKAA